MSLFGRLRLTLVVPIGVIALFGGKAYTQANLDPASNNLPSPYQTTRNWGTMPAGRTWGSTAGVDIDPDGRSIWAIDRCGANSCAKSNLAPILKFDASGKLVRSFGAGMFLFPHGIHVDREGNVWVTDLGVAGNLGNEGEKGKGSQVIKFSPEGKVLLTLGKPGVKGHPPDYLDEPCDVATSPNGDIFVADGHSGQDVKAAQDPRTVARIVKFDRNGKFIKTWGKLGSGPGEFKTLHAVVFDARGRLFVADRGNHRIQIFDQEGKFLEEWKEFSRVSGMYIRNDTLYAADSETNATNHPGWRKGIRIGSAQNGKVMAFIPPHQTDSPDGAAGEGVAVDAEGNVYAAEVTVRGLTKYVKR